MTHLAGLCLCHPFLFPGVRAAPLLRKPQGCPGFPKPKSARGATEGSVVLGVEQSGVVGQQSRVATGVTLTRGTTRGSSASQTSCAVPQIPVTCDSSRTGPTGNITQTANKGGDTPPICSSTLRNPKVFYPKQNWNNGRHNGGVLE